MRTGERGFGPALQTDTTDFEDWRATYRWPFIALCLVLSLGAIASGGSRADAEQQPDIKQSTQPAVELQSTDSSVAKISADNAVIASAGNPVKGETRNDIHAQSVLKSADSETTSILLQTRFNAAQPQH